MATQNHAGAPVTKIVHMAGPNNHTVCRIDRRWKVRVADNRRNVSCLECLDLMTED